MSWNLFSAPWSAIFQHRLIRCCCLASLSPPIQQQVSEGMINVYVRRLWALLSWLYIDIGLIMKLPSAAITLKSVIVGPGSSKLQTFLLGPLPWVWFQKLVRYTALRIHSFLLVIPPERTIEDHESVLEVLSGWGMDTDSRLCFRKNFAKYEFFRKPLVSLLEAPPSLLMLVLCLTQTLTQQTATLTKLTWIQLEFRKLWLLLC